MLRWLRYVAVVFALLNLARGADAALGTPGVAEGPAAFDPARLAATLATLTPEQWEALPPELREQLQAILGPAWRWGTTLRVGAEWRDNVLLSPVSPTARSLLRAQLESYVWRRPAGAWEWLGFLNGNVGRLADPLPELTGEQEWFGHGEGRWTPRPGWRAAWTGQAYYQDQVFDLSATETDRFVARMRVRGARTGLDLTAPLPGAFAVAVGAKVHRSDYADFSEDFTEREGATALRWRRERGERGSLTVELGWRGRRRQHPDRNQYTAGGRPLAGTQLEFRQEEFRLETTLIRGPWTGSLEWHRMENRDQASGYFNYTEQAGQLTLERATERWLVVLEGSASRSRYGVQTVGIGFDPPLRRRSNREVRVRVERILSPRWTLFAEAREERSRENEEGGTYRARAVSLGVSRAWAPSLP